MENRYQPSLIQLVRKLAQCLVDGFYRIQPSQAYRYITGVKKKDGTALDVSDVKVLGGVDPTRPGYYELTYRYEKGSDVAETYLTVVVPEEVAK